MTVPSEDLSALEQRLRRTLRDDAITSGRVRLQELIQLKPNPNSANDSVRQLIYRLEDRGLAAKIQESGPRTYSVEDALNLLLALYLNEQAGMTPLHAAEQVLEYRRLRGEGAGTAIIESVIHLSFDRIERIVLPELLRVVTTKLFACEKLPVGSLVALIPARTGAHGQIEDPVVEDFQQPRAIFVGTISELQELVRVPLVSASAVGLRTVVRRLVPEKPARYQVLLATPTTAIDHVLLAPTDDWAYRDATRESAPEAANAAALSDIVHFIAEGSKQLRSTISQELSEEIRKDPRREYRTSNFDPILWLMTRITSALAAPDAPNSARSSILQAFTNPTTHVAQLTEIASSRIAPWSRSTGVRTMRSCQLLSGFGWSAGTTLGLVSTEPPFDLFLSHLSMERDADASVQLSCITVPMWIPGEKSAAMLYVSMPKVTSNEDFRARVRALQILAPVVAERIQRGIDIAHTVANSQQAAKFRFQTSAELVAQINATLPASDNSSTGARGAPNDRLVCIVLQPVAATSPVSDLARHWLREQLELSVPETFLARAFHESGVAARNPQVIAGELSDKSIAIVILEWLTPNEVASLRDRLITTINSLPFAESEVGDVLVRLSAWAVDIRRSELPTEKLVASAGNKASCTRMTPGEHLLGRARGAEKALIDIVNAHQAHVAGDWRGALRHVRSGLQNDKDNRYLLRRAAEFSISLGDFDDGLEYAELAGAASALTGRADASSESGHTVGSYCLLGDAHLGLGNFKRALEAYDNAIMLDPTDLAGVEGKAFALLTVARLLRRRGVEQLVEATKSRDSDDHAKVIMQAAERLQTLQDAASILATASTNILHKMRLQLTSTGTEQVEQDQTRTLALATALGLYEAEVVRGRANRAVELLLDARTDLPRELVLYRELIWARIWKDRRNPNHVAILDGPDLEQLVQDAQKPLVAPASERADRPGPAVEG